MESTWALVKWRDPQTMVAVYEEWSAEWLRRFVMREDGEREYLYDGPNPFKQVPWVKMVDPEWLKSVGTERD